MIFTKVTNWYSLFDECASTKLIVTEKHVCLLSEVQAFSYGLARGVAFPTLAQFSKIFATLRKFSRKVSPRI